MGALHKVVTTYWRAKLGRPSAPTQFQNALADHAAKYAAAYGDMDYAYTPKFHFSRHLPLQADEDDCNPDCFVGERGNSKMKQAADPVDNTSSYESTVLCRTLLKHEQVVQDFHADGLLGKCHEFPEGKLAKHVTWRGNLFRCDDIIFLREAEPFLIEGCAEIDGELLLYGNRFDPGPRLTESAARWFKRDLLEHRGFPLQHFMFATYWYFDSDATVILEP